MLSVSCSPSRYTQGMNATASLGREMTGLGLRGPALVLAGRSVLRLLAETLNRTFSEAGRGGLIAANFLLAELCAPVRREGAVRRVGPNQHIQQNGLTSTLSGRIGIPNSDEGGLRQRSTAACEHP
jgi:hypothetical protein